MNAKRDQNHTPTLLGVSNTDGLTPVTVYADPVTHRLLVDSVTGAGIASINADTTSAQLITGANGIGVSNSTPGTTALSLGAITPSTVNGVTVSGSSTPSLAVTGTASISNANTGDQTLPVKATGAEINTGTDDAKFATAKTIADSTIMKSPASSTDNAIARFDGTTGKLLQNGTATLTDGGQLGLNGTVSEDPYVILHAYGSPYNAVFGQIANVLVLGSSGVASALQMDCAPGGNISFLGMPGTGSGAGGVGTFGGGHGGATGTGGAAIVQGGAGGATSGAGGDADMTAGSATSGNSNGGNLGLRAGLKSGSGVNGSIYLYDANLSAPGAQLDLSLIASSSKTFTFPNETGTLAVGTPWTTWVPTFANFTKGSATITARYTMIGKTVHYYLAVTLAANSSMGTSPTYSLPVTASSSIDINMPLGNIYILDSGAAEYVGSSRLGSTTTGTVTINSVNQGTYTGIIALTATVPMTWTTNDSFRLSGTYEAA